MYAIYKYKLAVSDSQYVTLPLAAKIISVALQGTDICLWAIVNTNETKTEQVVIEVYGTGHPFPHPYAGMTIGVTRRDFIGTVVAGKFVWHIFQVVDPTKDPTKLQLGNG